MKTKIILLLFIFTFLTGCAIPSAQQPTEGDISEALTALAPKETLAETGAEAPDDASAPEQESTPVPGEPEVSRLWVDPMLPVNFTNGLVLPAAVERVDTREAANLWLEAGGGGQQVSSLVYVLVAPFPALEDAVSSADLIQSWAGDQKGVFTGGRLYLTEATKEIFARMWGEPGTGFVNLSEQEEMLSTVWAAAPSWALVPFEQLVPQWKVLQVDGISPIWKEFEAGDYSLSVPVGLSGENEEMVTQLAAAFSQGLPAVYNRDADKMTTVVLTGVTALVRATAYEMENEGVLHPAEAVGEFLRDADIAHISNEVPFAEACPFPKPVSTRLVFCSAPKYMELLEYIGTDVVELTGDHFSDWGTEATLYTFDLYDDKGMAYYGGGRTPEEGRKPITFENNGNKIAFIGCNGKGGVYTPSVQGLPGAVDCDFDLIQNEIGRLKDEGYVVIMTFQHHELYSFDPSPTLTKDFEFTAQAGADIVSGSQAHQPHGLEFYGDSLIMYGLGNLFFDQLLMGDNTTRAMMARHIIYDGKYISTEIFTIYFEDFSRPLFMDESERIRLLNQVFAYSEWGDLTYGLSFEAYK